MAKLLQEKVEQHHEEAAHRRELCDLLATQAALIDEASREAQLLAAALEGTEAARWRCMEER